MFRQRRHVLRILQRGGSQTLSHPGRHDPQRQRVDRCVNEAGLTAKSLYVRAEGNDLGVPPTAAEGTKPFYYDKGLPIEKALHPDTILAWAQNGRTVRDQIRDRLPYPFEDRG